MSGDKKLTIFEGIDKLIGNVERQGYTIVPLSLYWKRNKKRFNSTLALDIQNVTNTKNELFKYYDTFLDEVVQKYQLGLIPILSYRIEF